MTDIYDYNKWRDNFLGAFRNISSDTELKQLALFYPENDYTLTKCKQRKNNLLRKGNRNIYLDDLYAISQFSNKTPDNLLLGYNNIAFFWSELSGENLFSVDITEKIVRAIKTDKNYRDIYIPKEIEDFLFYSKAVVFEFFDKKIKKPIFNISDNSLDFKTTALTDYSYNPHLFYGSDAYDVFCDYIMDLDETDFSGFCVEDVNEFVEKVGVYLDTGKCEVNRSDKDIDFRIKNWACNCTMWLLLSYIADTCERLSCDIEAFLEKHHEVITFMLELFIFGARVTKQKRVTDEETNEKKRVRYSVFLSCSNEKLVAREDDFDDYDYEYDYKTASISDMQKSSLSDILSFEMR